MREYTTLITLIAIVAVVAGAVYVVKQQSAAALQPSLTAKQAVSSPAGCTATAKTFFHTWLTAPGNSDMGVITHGEITYSSHFSTSTRQCYIRIDSKPKYTKPVPLNDQGSTSADYVYVFNVSNGQAVASSDITMMGTLELCIFNGRSETTNQEYCADHDSFIAHVNTLMNN